MNASSSNQDSNPTSIQLEKPNLKSINPEVIRAFTPIFIAAIGCVIGVVVLFRNPDNQSAFSLASTAIAGAAGLAQPTKESKSKPESHP